MAMAAANLDGADDRNELDHGWPKGSVTEHLNYVFQKLSQLNSRVDHWRGSDLLGSAQQRLIAASRRHAFDLLDACSERLNRNRTNIKQAKQLLKGNPALELLAMEQEVEEALKKLDREAQRLEKDFNLVFVRILRNPGEELHLPMVLLPREPDCDRLFQWIPKRRDLTTLEGLNRVDPKVDVMRNIMQVISTMANLKTPNVGDSFDQRTSAWNNFKTEETEDNAKNEAKVAMVAPEVRPEQVLVQLNAKEVHKVRPPGLVDLSSGRRNQPLVLFKGKELLVRRLRLLYSEAAISDQDLMKAVEQVRRCFTVSPGKKGFTGMKVKEIIKLVVDYILNKMNIEANELVNLF